MRNTGSSLKNHKPILSIGLPVYNGERFLRFTLDAILAQTYDNFELLISDNASNDSTKLICQEYAAKDHRIRYYRNSENIGAANNFNRVFEMAQGKYFKWAAADDLISPDFLEKCVDVLENNPDILLCYSKADKISSSGVLEGTYDYPMRVDDPEPHVRFGDLILTNHFCIAIFGIIRREVLLNTPLIGKYVGSDRVLLAELGLRGRLYEVQEYLFHRRDHPQTSGRAFNKYKRLIWFDPTQKSRINLVYWKVGSEYLAAIFRSPISIPEKLKCTSMLSKWAVRKRATLLNDIKTAIYQLIPGSRTMVQAAKKMQTVKYKTRGEL